MGQAIRVAQVGIAPTIASPASLTVTTSVVGSVTYGYEVAFGDTNGGVAPVSAAYTITNGPATLHGGGGVPRQYNTIIWPSNPSGVAYALVYRSQAGGAYQLIDIVNLQGTSYNQYQDFGKPAIDPASLPPGLPSAPSASPVLPDLFSTIAAASGSTLTLAGAPASSVAAASVFHDDTNAIQAAIDSMSAAGGSIFIPAGQFNINACHLATGGWRSGLQLFGKNNLTIAGQGAGSILNFESCRSGGLQRSDTIALAMTPYVAGAFTFLQSNYPELPAYGIAPAALSSNSLSFNKAPDASHFNVGDYIFVRTGNFDSGTTLTPDSELNQVTGIDLVNGTLSLRWPTEKAYQAQCFASGNDGIATTDCSGGKTPAILGVADANAYTTNSIDIHDLTIRGDYEVTAVDGVAQVDGLTITNSWIDTGNANIAGARNTEVSGTTIVDSDGTGDGIAASGASEVNFHNNTVSAPWALVIQANEGASSITVDSNTFTTPANGTLPSYNQVISFRGGCHNVTVSNNNFIGSNGDAPLRFDYFQPSGANAFIGCERTWVYGNTFQASTLPDGAVTAIMEAMNPDAVVNSNIFSAPFTSPIF